jgi:hypothetical protein
MPIEVHRITSPRLASNCTTRGAEGDGDLLDASGAEDERPESAQEPVAQGQAWCPPATTTKDDQLPLEQEILGDHRSHVTGAEQLRGRESEVREQEVLHARVSVGQTPRAMHRLSNPGAQWGINARTDNSRPTGTVDGDL